MKQALGLACTTFLSSWLAYFASCGVRGKKCRIFTSQSTKTEHFGGFCCLKGKKRLVFTFQVGNILMGKLNIREEQIVYVGDSLNDDIQARSCKLKFYGCTWHNPKEEPFTAKGIQTISNPREIIQILENTTTEE